MDEKKRKEYSEQQAKIAVTTSVPLATTPSVILTETIKAPITLAEIGTLTAVGALKPEQRSLIHIGDQSDWRSSLGKTVVLAEIKNISKDVTVIDEFCKNNPAFMKALRKESRQTIVNLEDFWKYKDKAIITINILPSVVAATATPQVATATPVKPPEVPKDEKTLLVEAFRIENNLPFDFKV